MLNYIWHLIKFKYIILLTTCTAAFVPCRFGAMGWVIIWTVLHKAYVASPYYEVVVYSTSIVALLNAGLFCRLYRSDVLRLQRQDSSSKVKDMDTSRYPSYPTDLGDLTHIEVSEPQ